MESHFFALAKKYEEMKDELKEVKAELDKTMIELGVGTYLQDPETGLVFRIITPTGTFVSFSKIGYDRTAKEGERAGSLSKKDAEAAGFVLRK